MKNKYIGILAVLLLAFSSQYKLYAMEKTIFVSQIDESQLALLIMQDENTLNNKLLIDTLESDSLIIKNAQSPDSVFRPLPSDQTIGDNKKAMTKDPTAAMLWSIIPGGGQFYNESYLKGGLFVISAGVLTGFTVYNYSKYFPLQDTYDNNISILNSLPNTDPLRSEIEQENRTLLTRKENFRDNAHLSIFLLGISYFIATMDAYVGAHLYDFDVEDEISFMLQPNILGGANISVTYRF